MFLFVSIVIILVSFCNMQIIRYSAEHSLMSQLFDSYDPLVRPVLNHKSALYINVSISITQGIEISEKNSLLSTTVLVEQVN
jgi:hypothetical protein